MKKIEEIQINGERVFLRKNFLGWSIVHPIKVDGKTNWKNLIIGGSWIKLGITIGFVILLLLAISEYVALGNMLNECNDKLNLLNNIKWLEWN